MADDVLWPENGWDTNDDPDQRMRDEGQFRVARTLEEHGYSRGTPYVASQPCRRCGGTAAFMKKVNG